MESPNKRQRLNEETQSEQTEHQEPAKKDKKIPNKCFFLLEMADAHRQTRRLACVATTYESAKHCHNFNCGAGINCDCTIYQASRVFSDRINLWESGTGIEDGAANVEPHKPYTKNSVFLICDDQDVCVDYAFQNDDNFCAFTAAFATAEKMINYHTKNGLNDCSVTNEDCDCFHVKVKVNSLLNIDKMIATCKASFFDKARHSGYEVILKRLENNENVDEDDDDDDEDDDDDDRPEEDEKDKVCYDQRLSCVPLSQTPGYEKLTDWNRVTFAKGDGTVEMLEQVASDKGMMELFTADCDTFHTKYTQFYKFIPRYHQLVKVGDKWSFIWEGLNPLDLSKTNYVAIAAFKKNVLHYVTLTGLRLTILREHIMMRDNGELVLINAYNLNGPLPKDYLKTIGKDIDKCFPQ